MGLIFCQQCFEKVIWGLYVRQSWHDGSFLLLPEWGFTLIKVAHGLSLQTLEVLRPRVSTEPLRCSQTDSSGPRLITAIKPQSGKILFWPFVILHNHTKLYLQNAIWQIPRRVEEEEKRTDRGMKELNNRALGSCNLCVSRHGGFIRHASQRRTLGLAHHPPALQRYVRLSVLWMGHLNREPSVYVWGGGG